MNNRFPKGSGQRLLSLNALILLFLFSGGFYSQDLSKIIITCTDVVIPTCYGDADGSVRAEATGGVPPYTYVWSDGTEGPVLSGVKSGVYTVKVTDAEGNMAEKKFFMRQPKLLTVDFSARACSLPLKASAQAWGGTGPFTYQWSTGASGQTITVESGVEYCVTVTDANDCTTFGCTTVTLSDVSVSVTAEQISCPGVDDGSLTATVDGGLEPITYSWSNGATTPQITGLAPGTYEVTATDANGCSEIATGEILPKEDLLVDLMKTDPVCTGDTTGNIQSAVSGGTPPYTYLWNNGAETADIAELGPGNYILTVTDASGCTAEATVDLAYQSELTIEATATPETCAGDGNGSASVTPADGVSPYDIIWSTGDTSTTLSGVDPGTYTVTVTDAVGCQDTTSVTVEPAPDFEIETESTDPSSCSETDGTASVTVVSGEGPFSIEWSTGDTTAVIDSLETGTYTVTVTNAAQCTASASVTINQPTALDIDITGQQLLCPGDSTASLMVSVNGGIPPFDILWSTGDTTEVIDSLFAGTYTVTVTDSTGCSVSETAVIEEVEALEVTIGGLSVVCGQGNTGSAFANVSGGAEPFTYIWSTGDTTRAILGLLTGTYSVTVTDSIGCSGSASIDIKIVDDLAVEIVGQGISCAGETDGSAVATATGGDEPYSYFWSNGASGDSISQLSAGTYVVTVQDANNCTARDTITISSPSPILGFLDVQNLVCQEDSTGAIDLSVMGGTPPYAFEWSTGDTTEDISGLPQGTYRVTITDANDCFVVRSGTVRPPAPFTLDFDVKDVSCNGGQDGAVSVTVNGGTEPFTYEWSTGSTEDNISDLSPGDYGLTVTDSNGCVTQDSVSVTEVATLVCSVMEVSKVTLGGDGVLEVIPEGGTAPFSFEWSNGETTAVIDSLDGGVYSVTVTDANGCTTSCELELVPLSGLGDYVWIDADKDGIQDADEAPLAGVNITLLNAAGVEVTSTVSDSNGYYAFFALKAGTYRVQFDMPENYSFTKQDAGGNDEVDSDVDMTGMTAAIILTPGEFNWNIDAGYTRDCINITDPGSIGFDQYICGPGNNPDPLVSLTPASGGEGEIEYLWMYSTEEGPFNAATWKPIPNSDSPTYDPDILFETTYFARCARRENCPNFLETSIVKITVGDDAFVEIIGPATVCVGEPVIFQGVSSVEGSTIEWIFGPGIQKISVTENMAEVRFTSFGTFTIGATVSENDCKAIGTKEVLVINNNGICEEGLEIAAVVESEITREIRLDWIGTKAMRLDYTIEHSVDGVHFTPIGIDAIPVAEVENELLYACHVKAPKPGLNYYRVRMTDERGTDWYSNTEEIVFHDNSGSVLLYPNPVRQKATLELFEVGEEEMNFKLLTITGQVLQTWKASADDQRIEMDLGSYPGGVYFLKIDYGSDRTETLRLVKH
ncbi:SdrD B-like domain-containing protein [Flavilitoribacter nigricans]|uniref:T9SS type A sorting domain-containing protein n=1 Tax=Flavilitoribacter nigricans (strain ATCC 23147 / DSM 23189 / NBRC 102662 / NCIMB 1420 / SS-2) TaxID=1122177 RepID=A0A2D0NB88_FLAN2|nr:SdrD B-like domain-containing protein [Flavilitoribacter nigricans]PHN05774.1 hypothetical protein CRP01_14975 [Flavilitoribacter nigricans DSM 23189 = NBRC 102662]